MKHFQDDDMRKQHLAEAAERVDAPPSGDPDVAAYRLVIRSAAKPLQLQLPEDFARSTAAMVTNEEMPTLLDRLTPVVCLALLVVFAFAGTGDYVVASLRQLGAERLPWPMLFGALLSLAAVGLSDRFVRRL